MRWKEFKEGAEPHEPPLHSAKGKTATLGHFTNPPTCEHNASSCVHTDALQSFPAQRPETCISMAQNSRLPARPGKSRPASVIEVTVHAQPREMPSLLTRSGPHE